MYVHIRSRMPRFFRPDPSLHALNFYDATSRVHADTGISVHLARMNVPSAIGQFHRVSAVFIFIVSTEIHLLKRML